MLLTKMVLVVSCALFCVGIFGVLTRRNAIAMLLAIELILNAANLSFVACSRLYGSVQAQAFALFIIALAACEAAVGLAIVLGLYRSARTVFADDVNVLKG